MDECCGAYCSEVCACIGSFAARQEKARAGMDGEVKLLARMATNDERREYLAEVAKVRGEEAAAVLRKKTWDHMRAQGVLL